MTDLRKSYRSDNTTEQAGTLPLTKFLRERHSERKRGFLTPQDRKILYTNPGEADLTRTQRYRIRQRLQNGVKDFELISNCFDEVDRDKVFDDLLAEEQGYNYLVHMGALLYEAIEQSNYSSESYIEEVIEVSEGQKYIDHVMVDITRSSKNNELQYRP